MTTSDHVERRHGPTALFRGIARWTWRQLSSLSLQTWVLLYFAVVYCELVVLLEYLRYVDLITNAWDLGILQQALYTTTHGGGFLYYTAELPWNATGSFFGVHFAPTLLLVAPFYFLWPGALTVLVIQAIVVTASAFPLYRLAGEYLGPTPSALLAMAYLLSPPILGALMYDFHVEAFLPVCALTFWWAWKQDRRLLAFVAGALLVCCGEYGPISLGMIALTFLVPRGWGLLNRRVRDWRIWWTSVRFPLAVVMAMVPVTLIVFDAAKVFSPGTPPSGQVILLGGSPTQIVWTLISDPRQVVRALELLGWEKVAFFLGALWTGLLVWILAPTELLPAIPWFVVVLLTNDPGYTGLVGYQYAFLTFPFVFVATAHGARRASTGVARVVAWWKTGRGERQGLSVGPIDSLARGRSLRLLLRPEGFLHLRGEATPQLALAVGLLVVAVSSQGAYSPIRPWSQGWPDAAELPTGHDRDIDRLLSLVPGNSSVSLLPNLFPQVADREDAYPYYHQGTEYLLVDVTSFWFTSAMPPPDPPLIWQSELRENVTAPYGLVASASGGLLYRLGYTGFPSLFEPYDLLTVPAEVIPNGSTFLADPSTPYGGVVTPRASAASGVLWDGTSVMLPQGQYNLTIWLMANPSLPGPLNVSVTIDNNASSLYSETVRPNQLRAGWTPLEINLSVPYSGFVRVRGLAAGSPTGIALGGLDYTQVPSAEEIG